MTDESLAIAKIIKSVLAEDKTLLSNYELFLEKIKAAGVKGADHRAISNAMQYKISEVLNLVSTDSIESIQDGRRQLQTVLRANNMLQNRIDFIVEIFDYAMGWHEAEEKLIHAQETSNAAEIEVPQVVDEEISTEQEDEPWTCPNCGREGNQKNFCGKCGCARPAEAEGQTSKEPDEDEMENPEEAVEKFVPEPVPDSVPEPEVNSAETEPTGNEFPQEPDTTKDEYVPPFKPQENTETINSSQASASPAYEIKEKKQGVLSNITAKQKMIFGAVVAALVLILVLVNGMSSNEYEKKCNELYAIAEELPETKGAIDNLKGDASAEERKKVYDTIQKSVDKLDALDKDLTKMQQEKQKELNSSKNPSDGDLKKSIDDLKNLVEFESKFLTAVQGVINYDKQDTGETDIYKSDEYRQIINNYATIINNYRKMGNQGIVIKDSKSGKMRTLNADELMNITGINDALVGYCNRKQTADARILNKLRQGADKQIKENNDALMKKEEVVFLTKKIYRGEKNTIKIEGNFYNGTKDNVSGIKDHLLDITLKAFDEEVLSIKDEKVTVSGNTNLAPGESSSNMTITYHVKNGEIPYFTTAEASIHKIHWVVRRVVKK